jgi:predicted DNA-binding protein
MDKKSLILSIRATEMLRTRLHKTANRLDVKDSDLARRIIERGLEDPNFMESIYRLREEVA